MTEGYVELHSASAFSFLEGASQPEGLINRAVELQMPAMALLDRNDVYGAAWFHTSAKRNGVRAHIGAEIGVADLGMRLTPPDWLPHQHRPEPSRISLLCESRTGYQNLCRLTTRLKLRERKKGEGAARLADVQDCATGLVCLTGGDEGPLAAAIVNEGEEAGRKVAETLVRTFGPNNVYVELQRHGEPEQEWRNQIAIRIARSMDLPVLATNGVRYANAAECEVLDIFTSIRHGTDLDHAGRLLAINNQRHLRSAREMTSLFRDVKGAVDNTLELSSRLQFELSDLGYAFPRYPVSDGETMDSFLRKRVAEGVARRYGPKRDAGLLERAKKQVEHELALISRLGFEGYFLIVWDIVQFCKRNNILIQGRGSAANSAVCYALEITAIDPSPEGEHIHPRKWNHDFIDMPLVVKAKQNTPSFSTEVMSALATWKYNRERTVLILCSAGGLRIGEALGLEVDKHISQTLGHLASNRRRATARSKSVSKLRARFGRWIFIQQSLHC